jgi:cytochrome P450
LERLQQELQDNKASSTPVEIQALPYLTGVVKEGLRLSMANPSRLPHRVPAPGWNFKGTFFPAGTDVGVAAFELHMDATSFPDPELFRPERWLVEDPAAKERMSKSFFAFGAGIRSCIAKNLAITELYMGTEKVVESGVLRGARACQEKVEIHEWFNSSVKGEKIELIWPATSK